MASFVRYSDERLVAGVPATPSTWTPLNLSSYLDDSSAIGALVRVRNPGASQIALGLREAGATKTDNMEVAVGHYGDTGISFGGSGNSVEWYNVQAYNYELYVIGEIHGTHVRLQDEAIDVTAGAGEFGYWREQSPTPIGVDSLGDIAAVIHRVYNHGQNSDQRFGLRGKGSLDVAWFCRGNTGYGLYVTGLDENGIFESYESTKSASLPENDVFEMGYILKGSGVTTILEQEPLVHPIYWPGFAVFDFSSQIPVGAILVGGEWKNHTIGGTNKNAILRSTNGTDAEIETTNRVALNSVTSQCVAVDANLHAEYTLQDSPDFWPQWWEEPALSPTAGAAKTFMGPSAGAKAFAGPAVDAGAGFNATTSGKAAVGPAADGKATIRKSCDGIAGIGVN